MLLPLIYFLPCIVSLLWFVSFLLKKNNNHQRFFCYAEGFSVILYMIFGIYLFPDIDYSTMVKMEAVCLPLGLLYPVSLIACLYIHLTGRKLKAQWMFTLIVPAIVVGVAVNLLCFIIGFDKAAIVSKMFASPEGLTGQFDTQLNQLYCFFTYYVFVVLTAIFLIVTCCECIAILRKQGYRLGDVCRFLFKKKATTRARVIVIMVLTEIVLVIPPMAIGSVYFSQNMIFGASLVIALAVTKHLVAYLEFYSDDNRPVTLYELSHLSLFYGKVEGEEEHVVEKQAEVKVSPAQLKMDKRFEKFKELMEVQQVWKDEELTAASLCEMMDVGRTTLSAMISQHYDKPLRDIINHYRIEEAKKFMLENPKATQEMVAQNCGFKNAQYFNTQFKKVVGDTPAMWLAGRDTKNDE